MTHIIPETDYSISNMTNAIQEKLNFSYTICRCSHCGHDMQIPLMVKHSDIEKINSYISILDAYLSKHPEIAREMIKEVLTVIHAEQHKN